MWSQQTTFSNKKPWLSRTLAEWGWCSRVWPMLTLNDNWSHWAIQMGGLQASHPLQEHDKRCLCSVFETTEEENTKRWVAKNGHMMARPWICTLVDGKEQDSKWAIRGAENCIDRRENRKSQYVSEECQLREFATRHECLHVPQQIMSSGILDCALTDSWNNLMDAMLWVLENEAHWGDLFTNHLLWSRDIRTSWWHFYLHTSQRDFPLNLTLPRDP